MRWPESLPSKPPRVNVAELHQALKAARLHSKSDDEKTSAFETRRANFTFKKPSIGDEMMAMFKPATTPGCERSTNTDHDEIGFYCNFEPLVNEAQGVEIVLAQSKAANSSYIGANAFNRQVRVSRREIQRVSLLVTHTPDASVFIKNASTLAVSDIPSAPGKYKQDYENREEGNFREYSS